MGAENTLDLDLGGGNTSEPMCKFAKLKIFVYFTVYMLYLNKNRKEGWREGKRVGGLFFL